jgi:hypothetical protein
VRGTQILSTPHLPRLHMRHRRVYRPVSAFSVSHADLMTHTTVRVGNPSNSQSITIAATEKPVSNSYLPAPTFTIFGTKEAGGSAVGHFLAAGTANPPSGF